MALFQMKWLRNLVRRNTNPIPFEQAHVWKQRLSIAYAFLAWNAFGFLIYATFTGRADWAKTAGLKSEEEINMSPAVAFSKQFKMDKANVIRIRGISDYKEYVIDNTTDATKEATPKE